MQLDYNRPNALVAGLVTRGRNYEYQSKVADVDMGFGLAVVRSAVNLEHGVKLPTADTQEFMGFTRFVQNVAGTLVAGDDVSLVTKGSVAMVVVTAVTVAPGEPVYIVATGADAGKVTNVSTGNIVAGGAVFGTAKKNDNLATVSISLAK